MQNTRRNSSILIVDDRKENIHALEKVLKPLNTSMLSAESGQDALNIMHEQEVVLVLLDVQMPGMDGFEMFERMSKDERTKHIPVIFITASHQDEAHRLHAYEKGAVDYLFKPINNQVLLSKVRVFLDLHQQRNRYVQLHERYQLILESAGEGIFGLDEQGKISFINPAGAKMLGWDIQDIIHQPITSLLRTEFDATGDLWENSQLYKRCFSGDIYYNDDTSFFTKTGKELPVKFSANPIHDRNKNFIGVVVVFSDMTVHKQVQAQLTHLALYDHLTGLANRLQFEKSISQSLDRAKRFKRRMGLLFIDIDHFKNINDTLGHGVGDELLKCLSDRLKIGTRYHDTVARISGDEFAVVLDELKTAEDAEVVAENLLRQFDEPFELDQNTIQINVSVGIATYPESGENVKSLIKNADMAMYHAKESGRNCYKSFNKCLGNETHLRIELTGSLKSLIMDDKLCIKYQPRFDTNNHSIVALETKLLWEHPELGTLNADQFLPLAEENGVLLDIKNWTIQTALTQAQKFMEQSEETDLISFELVSTQLMLSDLSSQLVEYCRESNINPCNVEFTLSENTLLKNITSCTRLFNELHSHGFRLVLKDFGQSYSSLSHLAKLPISAIKFDPHQFTHEVCEAIIAFAKKLHISTIATGVESSAQAEFIKKSGSDCYQGSFLAEPKSFDELSTA